jgi:hypothetical protein
MACSLRPKRGGDCQRSPTDKFAPQPVACRTCNLQPVAYQHRSQRRHNSKAPNEFGLLSPKTRYATPCPRRHCSRRPDKITGCQQENKPNFPPPTDLRLLSPKMRWATRCNVSPAASLRTTAIETTSALCRPKRLSRHNSPRDNNPPAVQRRSQRRRPSDYFPSRCKCWSRNSSIFARQWRLTFVSRSIVWGQPSTRSYSYGTLAALSLSTSSSA